MSELFIANFVVPVRGPRTGWKVCHDFVSEIVMRELGSVKSVSVLSDMGKLLAEKPSVADFPAYDLHPRSYITLCSGANNGSFTVRSGKEHWIFNLSVESEKFGTAQQQESLVNEIWESLRPLNPSLAVAGIQTALNDKTVRAFFAGKHALEKFEGMSYSKVAERKHS